MASVELKCVQGYRSNGQLKYESFSLNGKLHNPAGPAIRRWYENGQLECEYFYLDNKLHNPAGPATRGWYENGQLEYEHFYLDNKLHSKDQFEAKTRKEIIIDGVTYQLVPVKK